MRPWAPLDRSRQTAVVAERGTSDGPSFPRRQGLDEVDRRILDALRRDARLSVRALAELVHVSRAAAHARVSRLEGDGVIVGYQAQVNPERLGLSVSALVQLRIAQHSWKDVRKEIQAIPEVWLATLVSGEYDIVLLVRTVDAASLRDIVLNRFQAIPGIRSTQTILILEEIEDALAGRAASTPA